MSRDWLEINDPEVDAQDVARRVVERMARRRADAAPVGLQDPAGVARALWQERFGETTTDESAPEDASAEWISTWLRDCDLVPRGYVIDWRLPVLGPIHAWIRRIINAEVRRYLVPALEKQSFLNRKVLQSLDGLLRAQEALARENATLRQEVERLQGEVDRGRDAG